MMAYTASEYFGFNKISENLGNPILEKSPPFRLLL